MMGNLNHGLHAYTIQPRIVLWAQHLRWRRWWWIFFIFFLLLDRGYWMPVVSSRGWDYMIKEECRFMLSTYWAKRQSDVQTCHERIPLGLTRVRTAGSPFCVRSSQSTWDRLPVKTNPHAIWCTNHFFTIFFLFLKKKAVKNPRRAPVTFLIRIIRSKFYSFQDEMESS